MLSLFSSQRSGINSQGRSKFAEDILAAKVLVETTVCKRFIQTYSVSGKNTIDEEDMGGGKIMEYVRLLARIDHQRDNQAPVRLAAKQMVEVDKSASPLELRLSST